MKKNGSWNPQFVPSNPSPLSSPSAKPSHIDSHEYPGRIRHKPSTITPTSPNHSPTQIAVDSPIPNSPTQNDDDDYYDYDYDDPTFEDPENTDHLHKYVPPEFLNRLATFPLFCNAPKSFHTKVASKLTLMQYHPQEYIIKKGDPCKSMYWILKGTVGVTSTDGESVYAELAPGSFFGEIGILFNRRRTATVVARTKVLVGVLTSDALNTVLKHYPLIERRIRDEAQERLAMLEKKKKYEHSSVSYKPNSGSTPIIPTPRPGNMSEPILPPLSSSHAVNASHLASQASLVPGPSLPPITLVPSPLRDSSMASCPASSSSNVAIPRPTSLDNVDASVSIQDHIKNLPMFQNIPSSIIHQVALEVEPYHVGAFEYIFHKGDTDSDIYFINNGEVEVIDVTTDETTGKITETVLARLQSGSYFGEMSFLTFLDQSESSTRSKSIRSVSSTELMVIRSDNLKKLCYKYPSFVEEMKKTAHERNKLNDSATKESKLSINFLINGSQGEPRANLNPRLISQSPSPTSFSEPIEYRPAPAPPALQHPQSQKPDKSLFSPNWDFNVSSARNANSRSVSPISDHEMASSAVTSITRRSTVDTNSFTKTSLEKKRKHSVARVDESQRAMNQLSLPLNPVIPSLDNFQNFQSNLLSNKSMFQYLPHSKRMRLASVSNSNGRRRSSVLSNNGPLPERILLKIFGYLPLPTLMKLRILSRRWRQLLYMAPNLFHTLDLTPWNTSIDDKSLKAICNFTGSRPQIIDISNCFHITDEGFSYMVNEIGISGSIKVLRMKSNWEVSAMSIMDLTVPSVGQYLQEIDLSNCRKVRDNVLERLIGWDADDDASSDDESDTDLSETRKMSRRPTLDDPSFEQIGCKNLKILNVGYCKHLTDNFMHHIAHHANKRLESLDLTRCTTITDQGFQSWTYRSFPSLKKLSLKDCTFLTDKSIISIANAASNLEILDLNFCCSLSNIAIEVLCLGCPNIRELDLSFCGSAVSDSSLVAISLHLRNLEKLILTGCIRVTRAGVDALLSGCSPLSYINISQCKNAHIYPGRIPAQTLNVNNQTKSAFVTAGPFQNIIEIVI